MRICLSMPLNLPMALCLVLPPAGGSSERNSSVLTLPFLSASLSKNESLSYASVLAMVWGRGEPLSVGLDSDTRGVFVG